MPEKLSLFARAKINYYLRIFDKRPDGFYNLESLMGFLSISDHITIVPSSSFSYSVSGDFSAFTPSDIEQDLVVRAARLLAKQAGETLSLSIHVEKNIPTGAGMGGGSSDAGVVLKALNRWFSFPFSEEELCEMSLSLGSELPVCVRQKLTVVSGRGDVLMEPDLKNFSAKPLLIIWPNIVCATGTVFKHYVPVYSHVCNDLTMTASALYPEIQECIEILKVQENIMYAEMNGSGSSCYGVFHDLKSRDRAFDLISNIYKDWWVQPAEHVC